ncbi:MAG: CDP-archaeol synthase [Patescibacteria group bacterium]
MNLIGELWFAFWIFLPAGVANMSPVLANYVPILNKWNAPVDFGKSWRGKRLLGNNKRLRGVFFGIIIGALISVLQYIPDIYYQSSINSLGSALFNGGLLGFGAMLGDIVESFFKRRGNIAPGKSWFPFDQTDYIIGGLVCWLWYVNISLKTVVYIFIIYFGLHLATRYIGFKLGVNNKAI